jgi:hypothetical protein
MSILLVTESTPWMSILLVVERRYTLDVHTTGGRKGYTLDVHTAGFENGYTLHVHIASGGK